MKKRVTCPRKYVVIASVDGDYDLKVSYTRSHHNYEIVLTKISTGEVKTSFNSAIYEPLFGPDGGDYKAIMAKVEALRGEFEAENQCA